LVVLVLASGNRDERHIPDPDTFDIDREEQLTLSFGHGSHYCPGAMLARMEARHGLEAVLSRINGFIPTQDRIQWSPSIAIRGPVALRMKLTRA
jgi:cytochrome P450